MIATQLAWCYLVQHVCAFAAIFLLLWRIRWVEGRQRKEAALVAQLKAQVDAFAAKIETRTQRVLDRLDELHELGGKAWDGIEDHEAFVRELRGEDE